LTYTSRNEPDPTT